MSIRVQYKKTNTRKMRRERERKLNIKRNREVIEYVREREKRVHVRIEQSREWRREGRELLLSNRNSSKHEFNQLSLQLRD